MMKHLVQAAAVFTALIIGTPALAGGLSLTVDGVRNNKGSVLVMVFDNAAAYDKLDWQRAVQYAEIPARKGRVSHSFPDLTGGPYAVLVFHDENGDQDLNFSGDRVLEGVGVSGTARDTWSPSFAEAAVPPGNIAVRLFYEP